MATNRASGASSAPSITSVGPRHDLFIGYVAITVLTTNPLQYTLVEEAFIYGSVYSFLINYGPNWELEPDLAVTWAQTSTNPSTWEFHLAKNAYFVDPRGCTKDPQGHIIDCPTKTQVKASDVKFTWDYVKLHQDETTYFKACTEHVASVDTSLTDPFYVKITYDGPYAAAIGSLTCVPILPQYIWQSQPVDWTNALPIGSGSVMVRPDATGTKMVAAPPIILDRNPLWHGKEVQGRQTFPDTIQYVNYETSGAMSLDLTLGKIDLAIAPAAQDYLGFLSGKTGILRQKLADGFEAEINSNVLTDDLRAYFASLSTRPLERGHTNPVLLNQVVRSAIHMATNREKMIQNAWSGLATPGDVLLPAFHPWHTDVNGNDIVPPYSSDDKNGDGNPFDFPPFLPVGSEFSEQFPDGPDAPKMARTMLNQAGWAYICATGGTDDGISYPLCRKDASNRMVDNLDFRFFTKLTEPWWETAVRGVVEDAAKAGIKFSLELLNDQQMYAAWYQLDYDVWLWDWVWTPITDPSLALVVQTCGGIITLDNDNGFCMRDPVTGKWTFDEMYNQTLTETDPTARHVLADKMQRIIYGDTSYNLPFYLDALYAMNEVRFTNWGDFRNFRAVPPDVGNTPIIGQVPYPVDQKPPQFTLTDFEGVVGTPVQFSVSAVDPEGGPLDYRWDFDAGHVTPTGFVGGTEPGGSGVNADGVLNNDDQGGNTATPTFTYGVAGTYDIAVRVSERGGDFFTVHRAKVTITGLGTQGPTVLAMSFSPSDPTTYTGDLVYLGASATDFTGHPIVEYAWDFGDGTPIVKTAVPSASHAYAAANPYTVKLTVKNSIGQISTPGSTIVPVVDNVAPVLAPLVDTGASVNTEVTFVAFASDLNSRDVLTYAWNFGDGTTATGNPAFHNYTVSGKQYTYSVTVSDGHGHSATSSALINIVTCKNTRPKIDSLTANPASPWQTQTTQVTGTVTDVEGNALQWQWDLNNDGKTDVWENSTQVPPGVAVTHTVSWLFSAAGTYHSSLTVTDKPPCGSPLPASTFVSITVRANTAPTLTDIAYSPTLPAPTASVSFSATSNDVNGDRVNYKWDWGDGTSATGQTGFFGGTITGSHAFALVGNYVVVLIANDSKGGEARKSVLVSVVEPQGMLITVTSNRREMMSNEIATIHVTLMGATDGLPVTTASLTPSTPLGGTFSSARNLGSGNYEFGWTAPTVARQTFAPINVLAKAPGYLDISSRVVILVDPNKTNLPDPTALFLFVRSPATSLRVGQSMTITVYAYTAEGYVVSGASLLLRLFGPGSITLASDNLNGEYTFTYTAPASVPGPTGILITITATKLGYLDGTGRLAFTVVLV